MKTFSLTLIGAIVSGICKYMLYYIPLFTTAYLLDINPRTITYDQHLALKEPRMLGFILGALIGGMIAGSRISYKV